MLDCTSCNQKVANYATLSGDWDWYKLGQILAKDCLDILMPIKAPNGFAGPDCVAWFPNVSGEFNLKSAYGVWFDRKISGHARLFKELWWIKSPQRLKTFMWVVVNNALLANHTRFRRVFLHKILVSFVVTLQGQCSMPFAIAYMQRSYKERW